MTSLILIDEGQGATPNSSRLPKLLEALGVTFRVLPLDRVLDGEACASALLLSEAGLIGLCRYAGVHGRSPGDVLSGFPSTLIYPFSGSSSGVDALSKATGAELTAAPQSSSTTQYSVADIREACGPFSGLRVENVRCAEDAALRVGRSTAKARPLVASESGNLLTHFKSDTLDLSVASTTSVFDVESTQLTNLNVSECFSGLVPLLVFLRRSKIDRLQSSSVWANWIIDDPNLRSRYGFLNLRDLAPCVRETGAAVSIAFIPWNYRRTSREIVEQFRSSWPQLSICIHGCDHTGAEFATRTYDEALPLIQLATSRMQQFKQETSLGYDSVMVFPRGEFSAEAMRALRASSMLAAVNTELIDCRTGAGVKGAELLKPAITSFGGFPLFLRRRAEEPASNFALDLMLGKPCLTVTHHQYFEPGLRPLRTVVETLNRLEPAMKWTNLSTGISSTFSISRSPKLPTKVRLYSSRTTLELGAEETADFAAEFYKDEQGSDPVQAFVNGVQVKLNGGRPVRFSVSRPNDRTLTVDVKAGTWPADLEVRQGAKRRLKVAARRYLTEVRDNYLDRYPAVRSRLSYLKKAVS